MTITFLVNMLLHTDTLGNRLDILGMKDTATLIKKDIIDLPAGYSEIDVIAERRVIKSFMKDIVELKTQLSLRPEALANPVRLQRIDQLKQCIMVLQNRINKYKTQRPS